MRNFGRELAYFVRKVTAGAKVTHQQVRYIEVLDRRNLGSAMRLGNMPVVMVGVWYADTQYLEWQC